MVDYLDDQRSSPPAHLPTISLSADHQESESDRDDHPGESPARLVSHKLPLVGQEPVESGQLDRRSSYRFLQSCLHFLFTRSPPRSSAVPTDPHHSRPKIAIVGAGLTGLASAAHLIALGFEVVIFDRHDRIGGIWADVNSTSGLQLNSWCYRFHPSVSWSSTTAVQQPEILSELNRLWTNYHLKPRTRLNYSVKNITRVVNESNGNYATTKWLIDNGVEGQFDGIILAIGTCGEPRKARFQGQKEFGGPWIHSSQLDSLDFTGRHVVCIGGGASGVEVAETAIARGASRADLISRSDKWFIPRNLFLSTTLAANLWGGRSPIDRLYEFMIRKFHYGSQLAWMAPDRKENPLFSETPVVNDLFFKLVKSGKANYIKGDVVNVRPEGVEVQRRDGTGNITLDLIAADVIVEATGYERPKMDFVAVKKLFHKTGAMSDGPDLEHAHKMVNGNVDKAHSGSDGKDYGPPNMFLGCFAVGDLSCVMTNAAYIHGVGSVGNWHIASQMTDWIDHRVKQRNGPMRFFTYAELMCWLLFFMVEDLARLRWLIFVFFGFGQIKIDGNLKGKMITKQKKIE